MNLKCFVVGPFGKPKSKQRAWSDCLYENIIKLAIGDHYDVRRTIDDPEGGNITDQIKACLDKADIVIADLSDNNANAFYELGFRHGLGLPFVLVSRADTETDEAIPFNLSTYKFIKIDARYDENTRQYLVGEAAKVISELRKQVAEAVRNRRGPILVQNGSYRTRVFDWFTTYSNKIAADWLGAQPLPIQQMIGEYETGAGKRMLSDEEKFRLGEYLALKGAAGKTYEGEMHYFINSGTNELAMGYAAYHFPTGPLVIRLSGKERPDGVAEIKFDQPERKISVGDLEVTLPRYFFTVRFTVDAETGELSGTIVHPETRTTIGTAKLEPKMGFR